MATYIGKYEKQKRICTVRIPWLLLPVPLFLAEVFAFLYLSPEEADTLQKLWPLAFGFLWSVILTGFVYLLPAKAARIAFGLVYLGVLIYAVGQTGYYLLFSDMMWLSDFRYASEGKDYLDVLLQYPVSWYLWVVGLLALGAAAVLRFPQRSVPIPGRLLALALAVVAAVWAVLLPQYVFLQDKKIGYARSNYGRSKSAEAAYENMFNPHRLYQVCGLYHMAAKDLWANSILPLTPAYEAEQQQAKQRIDDYLQTISPESPDGNEMTGLLAGKNVVLVMMESLDDWMLGDHTPTINRLMGEGITFTNFYTPSYGGIRTFNTEFCINTGNYLSSKGGFALDYATNSFDHSLASLLTEQGYSAKLFHYNDPCFYSRDVFTQALGYEEYVCYADFLSEYSAREQKQLLYDDLLLFKNPQLRQEFFRQGEKRFNFIITRSAHLSYKYNEVLSHWALKKYPEYKGFTGSEETDCGLVKARLVDDLFQWLLMELEEEGELENTVIIGITDHYTYGYKNTQELLELSGVEDTLLLEKTPCFIWSPGLAHREVDKVLHTADLLPTVLNLLGVDTDYNYIGQDAFDESYEGFVPFSNGSWIADQAAYDASTEKLLLDGEAVTDSFQKKMEDGVKKFVEINNQILETDYYGS